MERITGETPKALLSQPSPSRWDRVYWNAFQELSGSRSWTFAGPAEIPYTTKIAWLDENQIRNEDDRADVLGVLGALDDHYLDHVYDK